MKHEPGATGPTIDKTKLDDHNQKPDGHGRGHGGGIGAMTEPSPIGGTQQRGGKGKMPTDMPPAA